MQTVAAFTVGEQYTNDQIRYTLNLENMGGIRPSVASDGRLRHLALMTATETSGKRKNENPYHDRVEGDVLVFTGTGRTGDHQLAGKNKRLTEQYDYPIPFYGFSNEGRQIYQFLGLLELLRYYTDNQIDVSGALRTVWIFEFRIHKTPETVPVSLALSIATKFFTEPQQASLLASTDRDVTASNVPADTAAPLLFSLEELRAQMLEINPYRFEHLVKDILGRSGFRDVEVTKASGDGGIDVVGYVSDTNDFLAGTFVQLQAKRWRHAVESVEINNFRGAMHSGAKGIFVTTSRYTKAASLDASNPMKPCITLVDGYRLADILLKSHIAFADYL